jgi:2-polyprenyl-3-methyl-5-hydroxy-6-metoxy-1,4-benzoquinol methylase
MGSRTARRTTALLAHAQLRGVERRWEALATTDPMWAILTHPDRGCGGWDQESFFATGTEQVRDLLARIADLGWDLPRHQALDFGCGIGRLTQALCGHFDEVTGVDVAPTMIETAETYNRHGDACVYRLNQRADLGEFPDRSFDLVYSTLVLQHLPPALSELYVGEFVRVVDDDGLAVFQIPTARRASIPLAAAMRRLVKTGLEMHPVPRATVESWIDAAGGELVAALDSSPDDAHDGLLYVVANASSRWRGGTR